VFASWNPSQPEITDLIVQHDARTLGRMEVRKQDVLEAFSRYSNRQAMRAVEQLPEMDGILNEKAIDRHLLKVHWEMQRLAGEFYHGSRVWDLLRVVIASIREAGVRETIRIVDAGCGIGYVIRWLAANIPLRDYSIELVGMDLNSTLINEANRLADVEELPCRFIQGDAFSKEHPGHIFISTGVIHHFRGQELLQFLGRHEQPETQAFLHFDFQPWLLAPVGAWFFHYLRMRTPVARHDGVLSAARAHDARTLTEAAHEVLPEFASGIYGAKIWNTPAPRIFHTLVGLRRPLVEEFRRQLGRRRSRLGELR